MEQINYQIISNTGSRYSLFIRQVCPRTTAQRRRFHRLLLPLCRLVPQEWLDKQEGTGPQQYRYPLLRHQVQALLGLQNTVVIHYLRHKYLKEPPGRVAQSVGHLTHKSGVLGSIPGLATYFRFSFRFFKKGSRQLLAKVCVRSTG